MYQIGDKVFYPMHGAGTIKAIDEKEVLGKKQLYCVISIPHNNMDVMLPMEKMDKFGVRPLVDKETMNDILFDFHHGEPDCSMSWKERYHLNYEKLKTGKMSDSAEVIRELLHRNQEKPLNASEKQLLHQAQRNVISEISLVKNISENQAADLLKISS